MNQSQINFVVKTLGAAEAEKEFAKIERAAKKAGEAIKKDMTVKQYLKTAAGEQQMLALQTKAAAARTQEQAAATQKAADATDRASRSQASYFGHIAKTTVQSALINQLFLQFVDVAGQAIQQVDLMQNFPATMASMGQSTAEAGQAMDSLRNYIGQVGGNLGDATSYVTRFTGAIGDVKAATAVFVGLNNALIAGDSTLEEQKQAAIQFAQSLERGKPDLREWRTLTQNMSFQLDMVAKSMGYVNANELGESLSQGEESMAAFTTALTKMSTGTGPIAEQAMARMSGMQFSFNVLKNTMVQGLAAIINTIGRSNIVSFFQFLTQVIQVLTQVVITLIGALVSLFNFFGAIFGLPAIKLKKDVEGVADGIGAGAGAAEDLADGMKGAGDEAKKLNKSLASFDKMNVLPDKESSSGGKDAGGAGGAGFDAGQMGELGNLFGDIGGKIQEVSQWAKIFAGILVGLAGIKFAQGIADQFNGIIRTIDNTTKNLDRLKEKLSGKGGGENIFTKAKSAATGLAASIGGLIGSMGKALLNPWVLLAVAIAAVAAGIIYLYNTNEDFKRGFDSVWNGIIGIVQGVATAIGETVGKAVENLKKMFEGLPEPLQEAMKKIGDAIAGVGKFFSDLAADIGLTGPPMEQLGKVAGVLAAGLAVAVAAWAAWNIAVGIANVVTGVFAGIMAVITSPIFLVVAAIAAVIAIIVLLVAYWDEIVKVAGDVWNGIVDIWNGIAAWFEKNVVKPVVDVFTGIWDGIVDVFNGIIDWITTNVTDPIVNAFTSIWDGITTIFNNIVNFLKEWGLTILAVLFFPITFFIAGLVIFVPQVIAFFQGIWDGIVAVFSVVAEWFGAMFDAAWVAITIVWNVAVAFFQGIWDGIVAIFTAVGTWMGDRFEEAWNAVVVVWTVVGTWFNDNVITPLMDFFTPIVQFVKDTFTNAWDNVVAVWSIISTWFGEQWDKAKAVFNGVTEFFRGVFQGAWDKVTSIFSGLWIWFKNNVWDKIVNVFTSIGTTVGDAIGGAFKGIINTILKGTIGIINGFLDGINWAIDTINKIPGVSIKTVPRLPVPQLATGGIITQPTLAMVGEAGTEAVVPLENNTEWIDKLAAKINANGGGNNGQPIQLTVQIGEEKIASQIISLINEKTQMSGRNTIYV